VAVNEVRKKRAGRARPGGDGKPAVGSDAGAGGSGLCKRSEPATEAIELLPMRNGHDRMPATLARIEDADLIPPPG
jgi:hypothetical protein